MEKKLKGTVKIGTMPEKEVNVEKFPLNLTIEELAQICCKLHIGITITLEEKENE